MISEKDKEEKGYTITYIPWEDMRGLPKVAGRFKTAEEKDTFLEEIHDSSSGWTREELSSIAIINDYGYELER